MRRILLPCLCLLAACGTMDNRGWQGDNAQPFDAAKDKCEAESAGAPKDARRQAFDACMAGQGWHRP